MRVRGEVFSGALRGTPLIEKYYPRLVGLVGFRPFRGTMDVKLERSIDIKPFTSKIIGHVLTDGRKEIVEHAQKMGELAEERFSIQSTHDIDEPFYECWAIQFKGGIYGTDVVELIAPDMIKEKLELGDNDIIEIEFSEDKTSTDKLPDPEGVKAGSSYS